MGMGEAAWAMGTFLPGLVAVNENVLTSRVKEKFSFLNWLFR
jgi:hypothetical protein